MEEVERSIIVDAPIAAVYAEWTRIEEFPRFMKSLREVVRTGENQFTWKGERDGKEFQSVAEVTLQIPGKRLAWRNDRESENSGVVCFERQPDGKTMINFKVAYTQDSGWQEPSVLEKRLEDNLQNFKSLIETGAC